MHHICKVCHHPALLGHECPFCNNLEHIEVCSDCQSEVVVPPGSDRALCMNCAYEGVFE